MYSRQFFFVIWSICPSFSLVHFQNCPEHLKMWTVQVFIPLMQFLLLSWVTKSFLVLMRYSLLMCLYLLVGVYVQYSKVLGVFFFCKCSTAFLILLFSSILCFPLFIKTREIFQCQMSFLYPGCIFLLFKLGFAVISYLLYYFRIRQPAFL